MTNIAELGIAVDSGDAVQAATDLDKLTQAGTKAEQAVDDLASGMDKANTAANSLATTEKQLAESTEDAKTRLVNMAKASLDASEYHKSLTTSVATSSTALDGAKKATTDWAAEQDLANKRGQAILATEARLAEETKKAAAATGVQADGLQALLAKINPALAALQKLDDQQEQLAKYKAAGLIDGDAFKAYSADIEASRAKLKGFNDETVASKGGLSSLALNSKEARENVLQLGNALAEGNIRVAAHNILEIGTNAGASALRLAAVVGPIALVAAGLVALGVAYNEGNEETVAFNKALILTGGYAGTTADSLSSMAKQVSATVGTTGAAAAVLAQLASSGNIASGSFQGVTEAALDMQETTGKAVDETIAEFVKIAKDPVAAAKDLNEQYNFLTEAVYSQIVALKQQGDTIGAAKLLTDTYVDTIKGRTSEVTANLSLWERGWKAVGTEAAKSLDSIKNIGRSTPIDQQITELTQKIAYAQSALNADPDDTDNKKKLVNSQLELSFLTQQKTTMDGIAAARGLDAENQKAAVTAAEKVDAREQSALTNAQKRTKELKDYADELKVIARANPTDARLDPTRVAQNQANINDKYKDPTSKTTSSVDLTAFNDAKNNLAGIVTDYKNTQQQLDAAQKAGLISQSDYALKREALVGNERDEVTAAYEAEIAALEAIKDKSTTTGAQRIQIDQKIADAKAEMVKAQKDADSQQEALATAETGRLSKQKYAVDQYVAALGQQQKALALAGQRAVIGVGRGDQENNLDSQLNSQQDKYAQQALDLANQKSDPSRNMSEEEFTQKSQALADANKAATDQIKHNYADVQDAQGDWTKGATSAWENYLDSAKNVAGQTKSLFTNAFSSMEDAIVSFATTGKLSFSDFAKSVITDMARIAVRSASSSVLSGLFGLASTAASSYLGSTATTSAGSTTAGYTGTAFSSYLAGARATGGNVTGNSLYQVNENGAELYNEGGRSYLMTGANGGSVTPLTSGSSAAMSAGSGSSGVQVSIAIASDGSTDVSTNQSGLQQFGTEVGKLVESKYKELEAKSLSAQGNIRKAINGRG